VWSPDGKEIVFARATAYKPEHLDQINSALIDEKDVPEFTRDHKPFRFDLYRIPFNDGKGGKAVPIEGASANGQSNYFPKFSPDGKWIVFTKSDSYMLLQPDSELWICAGLGRQRAKLRYNTPRMNSWHSWSSNSRWLVFSSKRTRRTRSSSSRTSTTTATIRRRCCSSASRPPTAPRTSPSSCACPATPSPRSRRSFLDAYSFCARAFPTSTPATTSGAERALRRGLELDPNSVELHNALGWTLFQAARTPEAVAEYERALAIDPKHAKSHNNLGLALVELGRLQQAADHYRASVELEPKAEIMSDLGFTLARMDRFAEARDWYAKALALDPRCASALVNLAVDAVRAGEYAKAEKYYREALAIKPNASTWNGLGYTLVRLRRNDEAVEAFREAVKDNRGLRACQSNLADALARQGNFAEAEHWYRRVLEREKTAGRSNLLAAVLRRLDRNDEATRQYEVSLRWIRPTPRPSAI
jgi:Flp pilus assembly protein TadD